MIESIEINNFQAHSKTTLQLSSGVNVIVGASDAGKSAILRALFWVLYNRPLGDGFRSYWGGDTSVTVRFSDGHVVKRVKTNKDNYYEVNGIVLRAFGQEPPAEVSKICNIDRSLNFQTQIDPFFLLQSSPGEVARYFNQIAKLEDIDKVTKGLDLSNRKTVQNINTLQGQIRKIEEELLLYANLEEVEEYIQQAEQTQNKIEKNKQHIEKIEKVINDIEKTDNRISKLKEKTKLKIPVEKALGIIEKIQEKEKYKEKISSLIEQIESKENKIQEKKKIYKVKPFVLRAININQAIKEKRKQEKDLDSLLSQIRSKEKIIQDKKQVLEQKRLIFKEQMPAVCPLCGQKIEEKSI